MNSISHLSRREMLLTSGLIVTGLSQPSLGQNPGSEKDLVFRTTDPNNAEPALQRLVESWITPTKYFYVRSHAPNPLINASDFRLSIEGMIRRPLTLSLAQLKRFAEHSITATLTCAGNRRNEFNREGNVGGVQWEAGAIGNAKWAGIALADVLKHAEVLESAKHVWFEGLDQIEKGDAIIPFGGSVPIEKAMLPVSNTQTHPGVLLAYTMNGKPLTADHGYPLRTVVPGYIGARSVKWLGKIVVSDRPSPNHYVATAYKIVKKTQAIDWSEAGPIYRYPINAAIASPNPNAVVAPGALTLTGYVLPSGILGSRVKRVLVSTDSGKSWTSAELTGQDNDYCWQLWKANVQVTGDTTELIVRATDNRGGFMPARVPWNAKGYLQNSWYRLPIKTR